MKIDVNELFKEVQNDGNNQSFKERVAEIAKLGFPIELIGLIVNNENELRKVLEAHFEKGGTK